MARSTSSHSSSCTLMSSNMRFAPTEKFVASLVMTKASKLSPGPPGFRDCVMRLTMSVPSEFILLWNSMQPTPSPRSTRDAPEFFFTTPLDFFATVTDLTPAGSLQADEQAKSRAGVFEVFRHVERGEFRFLAGMIFERLPIQG